MTDKADEQTDTVDEIFNLSNEFDTCHAAEMHIVDGVRALKDALHDYQMMTPKNTEIREKLEKEIRSIEGIFDESNTISVNAGHRFEQSLLNLAAQASAGNNPGRR